MPLIDVEDVWINTYMDKTALIDRYKEIFIGTFSFRENILLALVTNITHSPVQSSYFHQSFMVFGEYGIQISKYNMNR